MNIQKIMSSLEAKHPGESEYLQAVKEVLLSIEDIYNQHPEFEKAKIIERLVEPDRIFTFRVTWVDDRGEVQTNLGYRVQFNNAIGPYKGGTSGRVRIGEQNGRLITRNSAKITRSCSTRHGRGQCP